MLKKGLIITSIGFLVLGIAFVSACRHPHSDKAAFAVDYVAEILDLTPAQQEQLDQYLGEITEKGKELRESRKVVHQEFMTLLKNDTLDEEQLKNLAAKNRSRMDEMASLLIKRVADYYQTLTPEQKEKLILKLENYEKWSHPRWE